VQRRRSRGSAARFWAHLPRRACDTAGTPPGRAPPHGARLRADDPV